MSWDFMDIPEKITPSSQQKQRNGRMYLPIFSTSTRILTSALTWFLLPTDFAEKAVKKPVVVSNSYVMAKE